MRSLQIIGACLYVGAGCASSSPPADAPGPSGVLEALRGDARFSTFVSLLEESGMADRVRSGSWTVLAPVNAAFDRLEAGKLDEGKKNGEGLKALVEHHLVPRPLDRAALVALERVETSKGAELAVRREGDDVSVGGSTLLETSITAPRGFIHPIGRVLDPPEPKSAPKSRIKGGPDAWWW